MLYLIPTKKMYRDQIAHNNFLMDAKFNCQMKKEKKITESIGKQGNFLYQH